MMESTGAADSERHPHGEVRTEVVDEHILVLTVDRVEKKNAFTPKITHELEDALTRLDEDPDLFVGVLTFAGEHTTAGLEMPLFFTEEARAAAAERRAAQTSAPVDPFSLGRRLTKPRITAVQGITFTIGIEIALGGDIVVAASDLRMCQLEPKRGLAPLGGATVRYVQRAGWGNAMYHLLRADEFGADEAYRIGLVQEVVEPADRPAPHHRQRSHRSRRGRAGGDRGDRRDGAHRARDRGLPGGHRLIHRAARSEVHRTMSVLYSPVIFSPPRGVVRPLQDVNTVHRLMGAERAAMEARP
jgi:enoyl-CoA hydratase/carnithine racemase